MDGMGITWTDPLGASNNKWSYEISRSRLHHEATWKMSRRHALDRDRNQDGLHGRVHLRRRLATAEPGPADSISLGRSNWPGDTIFVGVMCNKPRAEYAGPAACGLHVLRMSVLSSRG